MAFLSSLSLPANLFVFAALASAVWFAGTRLSYLADAIAKHTGVSRAIMGLIFLAAITSLPELVTTSAAAVKGDAALALNNMFGGITMQTAILAVADAVAVRVTLSAFPRKPTPILEGALLILLLTTTLVIISVGDLSLFFNVGMGAALLAGIYFISIIVLNRYDKDHAWRPVHLPEPEDVTRSFRGTHCMTCPCARSLSNHVAWRWSFSFAAFYWLKPAPPSPSKAGSAAASSA